LAKDCLAGLGGLSKRLRTRTTKDQCVALRENGTRAFQKSGDCAVASAIYSKYIAMCHDLQDDVTDKEKKAMIYQGYSNRSTILFRAGEYRLCAEDVDAALDYSTKGGKEFLLLDRKAKCFMNQAEKREEAEGAFMKALEASEKAEDVPDKLRVAFKKQIETSVAKLKKGPEEETALQQRRQRLEDFLEELKRFFPPDSIHDPSSSITSKVEIVYGGKDVGRLVVAVQGRAFHQSMIKLIRRAHGSSRRN
jgi:tetratricopeptide (TPR) repeat protein